ncbi:hypothetical protein IJ103_01280 [Candidatus Saccharibacteria bacterium]|nr:hypothetical protein [Candidatus Saccharibacteria bacterium]MBQ9016866.1 hypothetical protein [Candidatus Saccharibacteria bacterium]
MSVKLTKKQTAVYDFIKSFIEEHNYSPSYRDIVAGLGLSSVSAVAEHVENLVRLGALRKNPGEARSLEIVDITYPETTQLFKFRMQLATDAEKEILSRAANILGLELEEEDEEGNEETN